MKTQQLMNEWTNGGTDERRPINEVIFKKMMLYLASIYKFWN